MKTATIHTERHLVGGRYRTHTRVGKGRLGEIFAATDEKFEKLGVEQLAAIQIIPHRIVGNNKLFNKLSLGYTLLKAGSHPNIVDHLQFGRDDKFGFLAMEYLEGASLRVLLADAETLPPDEAKPVVRSIGEALGHLHTKDIVHGNLTTRNVFITEDLEVRLLDVVPLNSNDAIFRGATICEPFGRCTVQDDVFGLACLAYEMLSGKHPFNYSPPGEARLAGFSVDRIASLTDDEWHALRLALSFERDERTSSVADFMRDFGIVGTERLRSSVEQPAIYDTGTYATPDDTPPVSVVAVPVPNTVTAAPVVAADPIGWLDDDLPGTEPPHNRGHPLRTTVLGLLLAGLLAWSYFGEPEEKFVEMIGYIDSTMNLGLVEPEYGAINIQTTDVVRAVESDTDSPAAELPVAEPDMSVESVLTDAEEAISAPEPAVAIDERDAVAEDTNDQPTPAEPLTTENTPDTVDKAAIDTADQVLTDTVLADANADSTQVEPPMLVVDPFVSVSERDAAARIPLHRNTNSTMQLTWWTSEGTANTDQDYIAVKQRIITDASLEDGNILLVSLINDSLPEQTESFFVNFGFRNTEQGMFERIATVRVDIIDDDLP